MLGEVLMGFALGFLHEGLGLSELRLFVRGEWMWFARGHLESVHAD
jgi:hypothetical protein